MSMAMKTAVVAGGTGMGVISGFAMAQRLTTLTLHYFGLNDASLPFDVVDAWTDLLTAIWSVIITMAWAALAVYLPLPASIATPISADGPAGERSGEPGINGRPSSESETKGE